jgi:WD40 repeat protein
MSEGLLLAAASTYGTVFVCDVRTGTNSHQFFGHRGEVWTVAWNNFDNNILASGSTDKTIRLWDIRMGRSFMTLEREQEESSHVFTKANSGAVVHLEFTGNGSSIVSSSLDNQLRLWNVSSGNNVIFTVSDEQTLKIKHLTRFGLCSRGKYLLCPSSASISLFDVDRMRHLHTVETISDMKIAMFEENSVVRFWTGDQYGNLFVYDAEAENNIQESDGTDSGWNSD